MTISERTKEALKQLTDSDGKIIITDDMSEDLKEAIQYINENNVDIFNYDSGEDEVFDEEDSEEELFEDNDTEEDSEDEESEGGLEVTDEDELPRMEPLESFDESEIDDEDVDELEEFL